MTAEPTVDRRGVASHWKTAGLLAGGLAVGYALVQERERVAGAVTNLQDTLTNDGLTLMHKLSEMADAFLAKVHETFVAAAPPTNLEAAVRHGLIGHPEEGAHHKPAAPNHSDLRFTMPWAEPIARLCEDLKVKKAAVYHHPARHNEPATARDAEDAEASIQEGSPAESTIQAPTAEEEPQPEQQEAPVVQAQAVVQAATAEVEPQPEQPEAPAVLAQAMVRGATEVVPHHEQPEAPVALAQAVVQAATAEVEPQPEQPEAPVVLAHAVVRGATAEVEPHHEQPEAPVPLLLAQVVPAAPASAQPSLKRKQRTAAARAMVALDADPDYEEESGEHPVKAARTCAPPAEELSLAAALAGTGLSPIPVPPDLDDTLDGVLGRSIAYKWEWPWGWAAGRLAPPKEDESNCTVLYKDHCSEQQTLGTAAYGGEAYGAWVLLDGTLAPPIEAYEKGKYLVAGARKRAIELHFPRPDAMKAARDAAPVAEAAASQMAAEEELDTGDFTIGARVYARGLAPDGERAWFVCKLLSTRPRYPPLQVEFLATREGETSVLQLPLPRKAFVSAVDVSLVEPCG